MLLLALMTKPTNCMCVVWRGVGVLVMTLTLPAAAAAVVGGGG